MQPWYGLLRSWASKWYFFQKGEIFKILRGQKIWINDISITCIRAFFDKFQKNRIWEKNFFAALMQNFWSRLKNNIIKWNFKKFYDSRSKKKKNTTIFSFLCKRAFWQISKKSNIEMFAESVTWKYNFSIIFFSLPFANFAHVDT